MEFKEVVKKCLKSKDSGLKEILKLSVAEIEILIEESITHYNSGNEIRDILIQSLKIKIKDWSTKKIEEEIFRSKRPSHFITEALSRKDCSLTLLIKIYLFSKEEDPHQRTNIDLGFSEYLSNYSYQEIKEKYVENLKSHKFCFELNLHFLKEMIKRTEFQEHADMIFDQQFEKKYLPGMRLLVPFL